MTRMTEADPGTLPEEDAPQLAKPSAAQRILDRPVLRITLVLLATVVLFTILAPNQFASVANARNISQDAAIALLLAIGATLVINTAGIDLSTGSVLVLSGVVGGKLMLTLGGGSVWVILAGLLACCAAGIGCGLLNGLVIAKLHAPALIVTLGSLGAAYGAALLLTQGVDIRDVPQSLVANIGYGKLFGQFPILAGIAVVIAAITWLVQARTRFGRYTFMIGSNKEACRRTGINVDRHLIKIYALSGLFAALAGFLSLARFGTTTIAGHQNDILIAITAAVLGGTSLFGGRGSILGTFVGTMVPVVLQNGFVIIGVQPYWQQIAVGLILIIAVCADPARPK
jgi:ribose transport system permease protein